MAGQTSFFTEPTRIRRSLKVKTDEMRKTRTPEVKKMYGCISPDGPFLDKSQENDPIFRLEPVKKAFSEEGIFRLGTI